MNRNLPGHTPDRLPHDKDNNSPERAAWSAQLRDLLSGVPGSQGQSVFQANTQLRTEFGVAGGTAIAQRSGNSISSGLLDSLSSERATRDIAAPEEAEVQTAMHNASHWLLNRQDKDGFWVAELECDNTTESYFVLFYAFMGQRDHPKVQKIAKTLRASMLPEGGWNGFHAGPPEISISVLSYFALKIAGVSESETDMQRSRDVILKLGGATKANTYTKYHLAWFEQYDWEHVPHIPPEMMFIPSISPINIYEMSSWSRTIFVPLSIIYALKPVCLLPKECHVDELFVGGRKHADLSLQGTKNPISWTNFFLLTDTALKVAEKFPIGIARRAAIKKAEGWMIERFDQSGGLGAILPAMMNSVLALKCLGYKDDDPLMKKGVMELERLEIHREDGSIEIQPCLSPVWDTAITTYSMGVANPTKLSDGIKPEKALKAQHDPRKALEKSVAWLLTKEVKRKGDWQFKNPAPPSGWFFEFENEFYPDVDDTIMVMMAMRNVYGAGENEAVDAALTRAMPWVLGMQNQDGGWASFDRDNDMDFLTKVPFADHNAMIDPSTADITARVLEMMAQVAPEVYTLQHPVVKRAIEFIKQDQCKDGSWFGRWGVNYMYGTWQVLRGLRLIGEDMSKGYVRKGVEWFKSVQLEDGGWGERCDTYDDPTKKGKGPSTPSQTAWAVMGLLGAGQGNSTAVRRGVQYLIDTQRKVGGENPGTWDEVEWTGTGFPKVFYLKYHYYRHYWPLMALAQYQRFVRGYRP